MGKMEKNIQPMTNHWLNLLICLVVVMITRVDGAGQVLEIGGLKAYVSGPNDSKIAVIFSSDILGFEVPHLRQFADKVGEAGIYALVPDFFKGDPFVNDDPNKDYNEWIKKHQPAKAIEDAKPLVEALKSKGITKFGAAGFCWGGKVGVDLTKAPYVQAAVLLHPTGVTVQDFQGVKVPTAILGAQDDALVSPDLLKQYESVLKARKVDSYLKIYPGVGHGWTTIYNDTDPNAVKRVEEAHQDLLNWFDKYLN